MVRKNVTGAVLCLSIWPLAVHDDIRPRRDSPHLIVRGDALQWAWEGSGTDFLTNSAMSYPAMQILRHALPVSHPPEILKCFPARAVALEESRVANVEAPAPPADQGFYARNFIGGHYWAPTRAVREICAMLEEAVVAQSVVAELHPFQHFLDLAEGLFRGELC